MKVGDRVRIKRIMGTLDGYFQKYHFNNIGTLVQVVEYFREEIYLVKEDNDISMTSIWCTEVELYNEPILLPKELFEI